MKITGKNLRQILRIRDLTQEKAANMLGITRQTLSIWLKLDMISEDIIQNVRSKLGIDLVEELRVLSTIAQQKEESLQQAHSITDDKLIASMETIIATKDKLISILEENKEQLKNSNQQLQVNNEQLQTDISKLKLEIDQLRKDNRSLEEEHRQQQQTIERLKTELAIIKGGQKREIVS